MSRKMIIVTSILLATGIILSACGSAVTPQSQTGAGASTPLPAGSVQVTGAGATFPLPVYSQWTYAYQYVDPSVVINYNGVGSGAGKQPSSTIRSISPVPIHS